MPARGITSVASTLCMSIGSRLVKLRAQAPPAAVERWRHGGSAGCGIVDVGHGQSRPCAFNHGVCVNIQPYKEQLLELETRLATRTDREIAQGREQTADSARDTGDASVADASASEYFSGAELDSTILQQVRDALRRIEDGTFGRCIVDGGPIEEKRLQAVPWTPYCLEHQARLEAASPPRIPTL
jgi:DnaK suppressor protein